jgi:hypothetical protein
MPNVEREDSVTEESWEKACEAEEADGCVAGAAHEHGSANCPRASACHCARPIGHPIPVAAPGSRAARR